MKVVKQRASAKVDGGLEFILSDATPDRMGDIIDPAGWELAAFKQNPIALFTHRGFEPIGKWADIRVEGGALRGRLEFAKPGTSPRIDELRSLTEQGILRAVSVGFKPIDYETFKQGDEVGIHFKRQELLETSLVSVAAVSNALAIAKSLNLSDDVRNLVFGKIAEEGQDDDRRLLIGKLAVIPPLKSNKAMTPMQKRVEDAQKRLVTLKDQLTEHLKTYDETTTDEAHLAATDELNTQIELAQKALDGLKRSEALLALSSEIVVARAGAIEHARPLVAATAKAKELTTFDLVMRTCVGLM